MTARNYDTILTVANATGFESGNVLVGNTSGTVGVIANVDTTTNLIKVKINNVLQEFSSSEAVHSNIITTTGTANGELNSNTALPFQANVFSGNTKSCSEAILCVLSRRVVSSKRSWQSDRTR